MKKLVNNLPILTHMQQSVPRIALQVCLHSDATCQLHFVFQIFDSIFTNGAAGFFFPAYG